MSINIRRISNEPGYLKALYKAFTRIFDFSEAINVDFIKTLHQLATKEVDLSNFAEEQVDKKGAFRFSDTGSFGVSAVNFPHDGFQELIERMEAGSPEIYKDDIVISLCFGGGDVFNIGHQFLVTLKQLQTKTDEVIQLIESKECFSSLCDYLGEIIGIEEAARAEPSSLTHLNY